MYNDDPLKYMPDCGIATYACYSRSRNYPRHPIEEETARPATVRSQTARLLRVMGSETDGDWNEDDSMRGPFYLNPNTQYPGYTGMVTGQAHRITTAYPNLTQDGQSAADQSSGFAAAQPARAWSGSSGLVPGGVPAADYYYYGAPASGAGYSIHAGGERPYSMCDRRYEEHMGLEQGARRTRCLKRAWSTEEDYLLEKLVNENGAQSWAMIADRLPGRVGKQCRERCAPPPPHTSRHTPAPHTHSPIHVTPRAPHSHTPRSPTHSPHTPRPTPTQLSSIAYNQRVPSTHTARVAGRVRADGSTTFAPTSTRPRGRRRRTRSGIDRQIVGELV